MKRRIEALFLLLALLFASGGLLSARGPESQNAALRYGVEWGFCPVFLNAFDYTYITDAGPMVHDSGAEFCFSPEGRISGFIGVDVGRKSNLSFVAGYGGVNAHRRAVSLALKTSCFFKGQQEDGAFVYASFGAGVSVVSSPVVLYLARCGCGWRDNLFGSFGVDFTFGLSVVSDRPDVWDRYASKYVPEQNIRRRDAGYLALDMGIALSF